MAVSRRRLTRRELLAAAAGSALAGAAASGCGGPSGPTMAAAAGSSQSGTEPPAGAPPGMRYRKLGRTGLTVSEVGFGGVPIDEPDLLLYAADRGINYVDTSPCYRGGASETAIGGALASSGSQSRDRFVVTTKWCPHHFRKPATKAVFLESLDGSLKRLRTDHVDVVLNHEVGKSSDGLGYARLENDEMHEAFASAKQAGKVRFLGASGHDGDLMEIMTRAVDSKRFDVLLCRYSFLDYPNEQALIDRAHAAGVGFVAMKTLAGAKGADLDRFKGRQVTFKQAALKWVLANPRVSNLVISIGSTKQVDEYVAASGAALTESDAAVLEEYAALFSDQVCRFCNACEPACPDDVRIADVLRFSMYFHEYGHEAHAVESYARLLAAERATHCAECAGHCAAACDYDLPVRSLLLRAHAALGAGTV
jgi:aryl-alcohol dehydrogenase-like predicted oxidoreductase